MSITTDPLDALLFIRDGDDSARWNFTDAIGSPIDTPAGIGNAATVTYSFLTAVPNYYQTSGFAVLNNAEKSAVHEVLAAISSMVNITFTEQTIDGEITFGMDAQGGSSGYAYPPGFSYSYTTPDEIITSVAAQDIAGDVWLSSSPPQPWTTSDFLPTGYGYATLIHETGHALGLKHPFEFEGDSGFQLDASLDNYAYTIMSYNNHPYSEYRVVTQTGELSYSYLIDHIQPESLMLYDIAALQYLYGANMSTHADDDIYTFDPERAFIKTLWDAGGTDTLSVENFDLGCELDLRAGEFSCISTVSPSDPMPSFADPQDESAFYDGTDNLAIAYNVIIENALGGRGDDTFIGNAASNTLNGGEGNDRVT